MRTIARLAFLAWLACPAGAAAQADRPGPASDGLKAVTPATTTRWGCDPAAIEGSPRLLYAFVDGREATAPTMRTACDALAWLGEPSIATVVPDSGGAFTATWTYTPSHGKHIVLTLSQAPPSPWILTRVVTPEVAYF